MFGRQDDVIKQDQKRKADVTLPDAALAALTTPPATTSTTDNPDPASPPPPAPPVPFVSSPMIDDVVPAKGSGTLPSPFDLAKAHQNSVHKDRDDESPRNRDIVEPKASSNNEEPVELSYDAHPTPTSGGILSDDTDHHTNTASYLNSLREDNPDLMRIKQSALEQLAPLVDQLQLSAEDKFKTLIMLIQASDNQSLIPAAYEAARQIENNEQRAQALLDVVNEINYFTRNSSTDNKPKSEDMTLAA